MYLGDYMDWGSRDACSTSERGACTKLKSGGDPQRLSCSGLAASGIPAMSAPGATRRYSNSHLGPAVSRTSIHTAQKHGQRPFPGARRGWSSEFGLTLYWTHSCMSLGTIPNVVGPQR
jgi:hypothetical protein